MRATEFLLEYDRQKTALSFGMKLIDAFKKDNSYHHDSYLNDAYQALHLKNIDQIPQKLIALTIDHILQAIEQSDPTNHKEYAQWLAKTYTTGRVKLEDIQSKGNDWLSTFHQLKARKILPVEYRDINRLSFDDLGDIANSSELTAKLNVASKPEDKGSSKVVYENEQVKIIVPEDQISACYYGRGTRWCTAAKNNNMYSRYAKDGQLYILLPKHPEHDGEKYQLHFQSGQFMDEEDNMIENVPEFLKYRFGDLVPVFKQLEPEINNLVIFADKEVVMDLVGKIKDVAMNAVYDILSDMEMNDEDYHNYLFHQGYQTDDGVIDWEEVDKNNDGWFQYNDYAREFKNDFEEALSPSYDEVMDAESIESYDSDELTTMTNLEKVIARCLGENMNARQYGKHISEVADYLYSDIIITKNEDGTYEVKARKRN